MFVQSTPARYSLNLVRLQKPQYPSLDIENYNTLGGETLLPELFHSFVPGVGTLVWTIGSCH